MPIISYGKNQIQRRRRMKHGFLNPKRKRSLITTIHQNVRRSRKMKQSNVEAIDWKRTMYIYIFKYRNYLFNFLQCFDPICFAKINLYALASKKVKILFFYKQNFSQLKYFKLKKMFNARSSEKVVQFLNITYKATIQ